MPDNSVGFWGAVVALCTTVGGIFGAKWATRKTRAETEQIEDAVEERRRLREKQELTELMKKYDTLEMKHEKMLVLFDEVKRERDDLKRRLLLFEIKYGKK